MTTKPSKNPDWGAPLNDEPSVYRTNGYPNGLPVPSSNHNWQFDMLGDWIRYFETRFDSYSTLAAIFDTTENSLLESSSDTEPLYPFYLEDDLTIPFQTSAGAGFGAEEELDLGFDVDDGTPVAKKMAVNSKYVVYVNDDSDIEVVYAEDLTSVVTFSLPGISDIGTIELAVDAYRVAVSYDSTIRVWDIDDSVSPATATQDTSFGGSGTVAYDSAADSINGMQYVGTFLYIWGEVADGTGVLTLNVNFAVINQNGGVVQEQSLGGSVVAGVDYFSVGRGRFAMWNGTDLAVYDALDFSRLWSNDFGTTWNTVSAIACGDNYVAIAGNEASAGDNVVKVYIGDIEAAAADEGDLVGEMSWPYSGGGQGVWRLQFDDEDRLWFSLTDKGGAAGDTYLGCFEPAPSEFATDSDVMSPSYFLALDIADGFAEIMDINLRKMFVYWDDQGASDNEFIRAYSMGRGSGFWKASRKRATLERYDVVPAQLR